MDNFSLKCSFCEKGYNEDRLPRNLNCGHSVCTICVRNCLTSKIFCPECRDKHYITSLNDAPINYPLARLIYAHPKGQIKLSHKIPLPSVDSVTIDNILEGTGMCPGHGSVITSMCVSCSMWVCMDCLVIDHKNSPRGTCKILGVQDAIKLIKQEHQKRSDTLLGKVKSLKRKLEEDEKRHDECRKYCRVEKNRYHKRLTVRIGKKLEDLKNKDELIGKRLVDQLGQLSGTVDKTTSAVELTSSCEELFKYQEELEKYMNKEEERKEPILEDLLLHLKVDLQHLAREAKKPLYISYQEGGKSRWSRIVPQNKGLLIYSLRDGIPPNDGIVLPFSYLIDLVYQDDLMVFLEVAIAEKPIGFAYVQLFGDSSVCDQTVELFIGEKGQCFKNTKFFEVSNSGVLHGGDFINNNGTGKANRGVGNFCESSYRKRRFGRVPGLLEVHRNFKNQLCFNLKCSRSPDKCPAGIVFQGLDVLKAASQANPIEESSISECGLFFPLFCSVRRT